MGNHEPKKFHKNIMEHIDIEEPNFIRTGGDVICSICNKPYNKHRQHLKYEWLNVLCDGTLIKL